MPMTHEVLASSTSRLLTAALLTLVGLTAAKPAAAQASRAGTGEIVAVREFPLNPGVDAAEFEEFVKGRFNPGLQGAIPGVRAYVAKGDRGVGTGRYAYVIVFDSWNTRRAYIPEEGQAADWFMHMFYRPLLPLYEELWRYADRSAWSSFTDYVELR